MSRAERIREFVKAHGPCLMGDIADAFCAVTRKDRQRIYWAVAVMCRDGILSKDGKRKAQFYRYVREPVAHVKKSQEERRARRTERERARRRESGIPTREEYLASVRAEVAQRKAERARQRTAKPKPTPKPARPMPAKRHKPTPAQQFTVHPAAPKVEQVAPAKPRRETSAEWMARTGLKPEVLPAVMTVKPWEPLPKQRKKAA